MTTPPSSSTAVGLELPKAAARKQKRGQARSYGRTAKIGAFWSVLRQGGNELIAIPTSMIMARLLSPHDFGVAAAAAFFIVLSARLTQFGFAAALVRIKEMRPEHATSVFVVNLVMGVVTYAALTAGAPLVGGFFRSEDAARALPVAALTFLFNPFGTVPAALMHRNMQFRDKALADWTDSLVGAGLAVILAFQGFGYWSIIYGHVAAVPVRVALQMYLSRWRPSFVFSTSALRELASYGLGVQSKRVLEYAAFNLDNVVVGRVLGITALGFYDKAFATMDRIVNRLTLGQAPFRIFAIIHEDVERFRSAYSRLILSVTLIGFPVLAGCIVVARPLFIVMYGERWLAGVVPFQVLCAGGMLKLLNAYAAQANEAVGNIWPQVRRQAIGMVLIVIGAAVGGRYAGITGAACGVLAALAVLTAAMQALVRRATGLSWPAMLTPMVPAVACALLMAGVVLGVGAMVRAVAPAAAAWQLLLVQAATGAIFYAAFVLLSPFAGVRALVTETLNDIDPSGSLWILNWARRFTRS